MLLYLKPECFLELLQPSKKKQDSKETIGEVKVRVKTKMSVTWAQ